LPFLLWSTYSRPITEITGNATVGNSGICVGGLGVPVVVAVAVPVVVAVAVAVGVTVGGGDSHLEGVIVLVSIVTAPFRAKALPDMVAPVVSEIDVNARIFPIGHRLRNSAQRNLV
jgi:hypothetical protein